MLKSCCVGKYSNSFEIDKTELRISILQTALCKMEICIYICIGDCFRVLLSCRYNV